MSLRFRPDIEADERRLLAPYAAKAAETRGRVFPAEEHPLRTAYQRDRDRIVHCNAFRRMEYKTQVFLPHEGDHFRTRLTHTMEVAQITRTVARCLRINEDLAEAIALVHDVGHTPFGHAGEDILNELLADCGGFNHNIQSLRVVDILEQRYAEHPGLNLTYEVREGIAKHETSLQLQSPEFDQSTRPTLEASVVDIADEIAYSGHDIDDGLSAGIIEIGDLTALKAFTEPTEESPLHSKGFAHLVPDQQRYALVRYLVNRMVADVLEETSRQLEQQRITDLTSLRNAKAKVCRFSDTLADSVAELKLFLRDKLYRHPRLVEMTQNAHATIRALYTAFMNDPKLLPERFQEMLLTERRDVVIADYIAGMTDRFAERIVAEFRK